MTVYTELLRERVNRPAGAGQPVGSLIADLLARRARLVPPPGGGTAAAPTAGGSPERLLELLDYDESLVRLCDELRVEHGMLDPFAPADAREDAEHALTRRLPLLAILEDAPVC